MNTNIEETKVRIEEAKELLQISEQEVRNDLLSVLEDIEIKIGSTEK